MASWPVNKCCPRALGFLRERAGRSAGGGRGTQSARELAGARGLRAGAGPEGKDAASRRAGRGAKARALAAAPRSTHRPDSWPACGSSPTAPGTPRTRRRPVLPCTAWERLTPGLRLRRGDGDAVPCRVEGDRTRCPRHARRHRAADRGWPRLRHAPRHLVRPNPLRHLADDGRQAIVGSSLLLSQGSLLSYRTARDVLLSSSASRWGRRRLVPMPPQASRATQVKGGATQLLEFWPHAQGPHPVYAQHRDQPHQSQTGRHLLTKAQRMSWSGWDAAEGEREEGDVRSVGVGECLWTATSPRARGEVEEREARAEPGLGRVLWPAVAARSPGPPHPRC